MGDILLFLCCTTLLRTFTILLNQEHGYNGHQIYAKAFPLLDLLALTAFSYRSQLAVSLDGCSFDASVLLGMDLRPSARMQIL